MDVRDENEWGLPDELVRYINRYMTTHVSEKRIMDEILMKHPVPDNLLKAQKLDEKSVHIQSFSGPYFPAFGVNVERYGVSLHIQSKYGIIRNRKTPNKDTLHAVFKELLSQNKRNMTPQNKKTFKGIQEKVADIL